VNKSLVNEERDLLFNWLKDMEKEKNINEVNRFFKEKLTQNEGFL